MAEPGGGVDHDVVVVGSGFGGSVAALRLTEKGYRVAVVEAGRRFADDEFAETSWDLRRYLWAPALGCYGIQRVHVLRDVVVLAGAGVGGGSLVYANTLYRPPSAFFLDRQWAHITDWESELAPHYDQAGRVLGVVTNPDRTPSDVVLERVAERMGVGGSYRPTPVGVHFGRPGEVVDDPYFGGAGPSRAGCTRCGACMTGCRVGAKNTLVKNYLHLAESAGARVLPMSTATEVRPRGDGTWAVRIRRTGGPRSAERVLTARQVVLAAGTWGTQRLLHRMRDEGVLPGLSPWVGELTRTISAAITGAGRFRVDPQRDFSTGVAITSSMHPDADTHVEAVRFGRGSNLMGLLQTLATDGASATPRFAQFLAAVARDPVRAARLLSVRRWSERTVILLVMQSLDNSLTTFGKRGFLGRWKLGSRQGHGAPNPSYIAAGARASELAAEEIGGIAGGSIGELVDVPMTAHFLGGCAIGEDWGSGVVDPYLRVHGYPGLSVVDGAAVSANLGVNPSLTIAAQAERAFSLWPNAGERDTRPAQGERYRRVRAVRPKAPVVPEGAVGALRALR
ncbi:FAD-dependent oxidoreductase [Actinosynnema sp.]|uniref:FAD-dependent oxidoreductase n=1 Tax=Actinosynnema sp. TaxID=1872144 RepID=UPI003F83E31E